jgi:hypothetical protein
MTYLVVVRHNRIPQELRKGVGEVHPSSQRGYEGDGSDKIQWIRKAWVKLKREIRGFGQGSIEVKTKRSKEREGEKEHDDTIVAVHGT